MTGVQTCALPISRNPRPRSERDGNWLIGTGMAGIGAFAAQEENGAGDLTVMIAIAIWAGLIGLALNAVFVTAERRLFGWHFALTASAGEQA